MERLTPRPPRRLAAVRLYAWAGGLAFVLALLTFLYTYAIKMATPVAAGTPGSGLRAILLDSLLFSLFAGHHSTFARASVKRRLARWVPPSLERSTFVWTSSLLLVLVCTAWQPVAGTLYRTEGPLAWLHGAVVAAGVGLTALGARRLRPFDLAGIDQALQRRSHRTGDPLVLAWPYSMVRHPIYLAWILMVFGVAHMTASRFVFAALSTAYLFIAIPLEERLLVAQFGETYQRYRQHVRWRVVPGIY